MLINESIMTLGEAASALPRVGGKKVATHTLWRWARKGVHGDCRAFDLYDIGLAV